MTATNYGDQPAREKQSELKELNIQFQEQGKRLSGVLERLNIIGTKLSEESSLKGQEGSLESLAKSPRQPGLISDLYYNLDCYKTYINQIEQQVKKLETFI